jgi:hypothetical protein
MEKSTKNWLMGCGIGCGAVLVILILLIITGVLFIKNTVSFFKESSDIAANLSELYGDVGDYAPEPDGSIKRQRIEAFLTAREKTAPVREKLERTIAVLEEVRKRGDTRGARTPGQGLRVIKNAFGMIPQLGEFYAGRNRALLEAEMSLGEYFYIYSIAYYSWLGKSPGDGPGFRIVRRGGVWNAEEWEGGEDLEERWRRMSEQINPLILPMLRNQLAALREQTERLSNENWEEMLEAEIEAMERDNSRIPWQDGLPDLTELSLRLFRQRFLDAYSLLSNIFEILPD